MMEQRTFARRAWQVQEDLGAAKAATTRFCCHLLPEASSE
jgi:hypothetical protein